MPQLRIEPEFRVGAVYAAAGAAAVCVYFALPAGNVQNIGYDLIGASAVLALLAGVRLNRPSASVPWMFFALGTALFVAGDVFEEFQKAGLSGQQAEALYLSGYPFLTAGLFVLIYRAGGHHRLAAIDEAGIATFAFAIFQWVFVMRPVLDRGGSAVDIAYTGGDVVLLAGLAGFFVSAAWRKPAFLMLVGGVVALLVGDEMLALVYTQNSYYNGAPVDAAWLVSYVLFGTAALHPSMRDLSEPRRTSTLRVSNWRIGLLGGALLAPATILLVQWARGKMLEAPAIFSAAVLISTLVLWRLIGILRALERIRIREHEVRGEAEAARVLLAAQNEQLREADRLKDEFVSLVSHDLRTPLTSVIGYTELVLDKDGELDDDRRKYLQIVARNADRLLKLVDDLLFIARLQAGHGLEIHPSPLDIATLARQAVVETQPRAHDKGVELRYAGEETVPAVADRGRLYQLLDNLVGNAIKFTPAGGLVEVSAETNGNTVALEVRDTGIGLAPGDESRLFERFFRTERAATLQIPGTGLGLFIAQAITEAHGGHISADRREGGGTIFRVELPVKERRPPAGNTTSELVA
jgi:signal transduction histidine kinase